MVGCHMPSVHIDIKNGGRGRWGRFVATMSSQVDCICRCEVDIYPDGIGIPSVVIHWEHYAVCLFQLERCPVG